MRKWKPMKKHPNIYEYETRKGKRYGVRRGFMNSEHKSDEFTKSGFRTWRDADVVLKHFEDRLYLDEISPLTHRGETVDTYYQKLRTRKVKLNVWRKSTLQRHDDIYNRFFKPVFGNTPLESVSRGDYQKFIDKMVEQNYSKSTIHTTDSVMQLIMNDAENYDVIMKNKLKHINIVGGKPARDLTLETKDYDLWLTTAKKVLNKYLFTMVYLLTLGERREELLGLKYSSFEFLQNKGHEICKITFDEARTASALDGGPLKNKASYRSIYVFGEIIPMIKFSIEKSKNIYDNYDQPITKNNFLFVNEGTGKPFFPDYANRVLKKVDKKCGIHINPHMLRHYFATKAKDQNLPDMAVMRWLGHANIQMTNSYTRPNETSLMNVFDATHTNDSNTKDGTKPL